MHPLRFAIQRFDHWLSRLEGVVPFTQDPRCILRMQMGRTPHNLMLPEATIPAGAEALLLHAWNERMPLIPPSGVDLAYAVQFQRLLMVSLRLLAVHIRETPALSKVQVIGGVTAHISWQARDGGRALFEHLGFTILPYYRPLGAFGEFWENFYTWWLMWAYNPVSARQRPFWSLRRTEFWMTKENFLSRYDPRAAIP